ncbi:MAG: class I SAM-dependent methyltransferase [Hyphomicrobiales bacterium]|nr:class I SAM-dependent methyltransferase [Hyphomicrobiales bacterium]
MSKAWPLCRTAEFRSEVVNPRLGISPWTGHRDFIADFLAFAEPKRILELGVFEGCSYLTMAETIVRAGLDTELVGVDTWAGDTSTGTYDGTVFEEFRRVYDEIVPEAMRLQIRFERKTFEEFSRENPDTVFDVIHFDGDHTRAATLAAYEMFLPHLAADSAFLFHDVYPELDYESGPLWQEMKADLPHFEFAHSWGLGILFPKGDHLYSEIEAAGLRNVAHVYPILAKARRDRAQFTLDKQWLEGIISYYWKATKAVKVILEKATRQRFFWPSRRTVAKIKSVMDETDLEH